MVKNLLPLPSSNAGDVRDMGSIPGSGGSPGGRNGNPLQDSCLENPITEEPGRLQSTELQSQTQLKQLSTHAMLFCVEHRTILGGHRIF